MMTSRERLLTVMNNGTPDHLPCQVHGWMDYYLATYLGGRDQYGAYEAFPGIDWVIYDGPRFTYSAESLAQWQVTVRELGPGIRQDGHPDARRDAVADHRAKRVHTVDDRIHHQERARLRTLGEVRSRAHKRRLDEHTPGEATHRRQGYRARWILRLRSG